MGSMRITNYRVLSKIIFYLRQDGSRRHPLVSVSWKAAQVRPRPCANARQAGKELPLSTAPPKFLRVQPQVPVDSYHAPFLVTPFWASNRTKIKLGILEQGYGVSVHVGRQHMGVSKLAAGRKHGSKSM